MLIGDRLTDHTNHRNPKHPTNNNHAGNVRLGIREQEALLQEFEAIAEKMGEPDADIDQLLEEQVREDRFWGGFSYDKVWRSSRSPSEQCTPTDARLTYKRFDSPPKQVGEAAVAHRGPGLLEPGAPRGHGHGRLAPAPAGRTYVGCWLMQIKR